MKFSQRICAAVVAGLALVAWALGESSVAHAGEAMAIPESRPVTPFTNPDFEEGKEGQTPTGWRVSRQQAGQGVTACLTTNQPQNGRFCVELRWPTNRTVALDFANLMQTVDATPWRNKRIKVTAAIRVAAAERGQQAQMWLRVDCPGRMGAFDNMQDRPVRKSTWTDCSITADVAEDAQKLNLGLMTLGGATAWWDHVRVEVLGEYTVLKDSPRPLDDTGLDNLVAFTRLLGFVRHYHPSDAAAGTDWLRFVVAHGPEIEQARGAADLAAKLQVAFASVAPTVRVFETGREPDLPAELLASAWPGGEHRVCFWEHIGYWDAGERQWNVYKSERQYLKAGNLASLPAYAQPTNVFRADLGAGVRCWVPTALMADADGPLPHQSTEAGVAETNQVRYSVEHRGARLATVMLAWNTLQHFYPYFDVVKTDWADELKIALRGAATNTNEISFRRTLQQLIVGLEDGHGAVIVEGVLPAYLQARVELIEDKVVVTEVPPGTTDIKPGDEVKQIEGRPARAVFDEIASRFSGTPQWKNHQAAVRFGLQTATNTAMLEVAGADGSTRTVKVACAEKSVSGLASLRPPKMHEIKPGIYYVDITRLKAGEFEAALPDLAKGRGIVFDCRGYPAGSPDWLTHLSSNRLQSAFWNVPKTHRPDHTDVTWDTSRWDLPPTLPQLTTNRVFLTDGSAISYAESQLGIIEAYRLGPIVGETTAGANGNITQANLPLGYRMVWTGMQVLKHDGSRHHGVGIAPTVPVARTLQGIRDGRDEQLEKALSLLK